MDREKVIKATELLDDFFNEYREVYYISPHEAWEIIKDTLKEQEAKKVTWRVGRAHCPSCGELFPKKQDKQYIRFCNYCGQAVKWE